MTTQGSGVPQPWAVLLNPVGILNTSIRFRVSPPKDVGNDKIYQWNQTMRKEVLQNKIAAYGKHSIATFDRLASQEGRQ